MNVRENIWYNANIGDFLTIISRAVGPTFVRSTKRCFIYLLHGMQIPHYKLKLTSISINPIPFLSFSNISTMLFQILLFGGFYVFTKHSLKASKPPTKPLPYSPNNWPSLPSQNQETSPPNSLQPIKQIRPHSFPQLRLSTSPPYLFSFFSRRMLHKTRRCFRQPATHARRKAPWLQLHQPHLGSIW